MTKFQNYVWGVLAVISIFVAVDAGNQIIFARRLTLKVDFQSSVNSVAKLYFDLGDGYREQHSAVNRVTNGQEVQTLCFALPKKKIYRMRFDPLEVTGEFTIVNAGLFDNCQHLVQPISLQAFSPGNQIATFESNDRGQILARTKSNAHDPALNLRLAYPVTFASAYRLKERIRDYLNGQFSRVGHMTATFMLMSCVAIYFAFTDVEMD